MNSFSRKLIVIITEGTLEKLLVKDILALGAHGYTVCDARGGGRHGTREAAWQGDRNIRIEVICDQPVAERIAGHLQEKYLKNYATTIYLTDVTVLRPEKF